MQRLPLVNSFIFRNLQYMGFRLKRFSSFQSELYTVTHEHCK